MSRVAVIGARGQLGAGLMRVLGSSAVPLHHRDLDLTDLDQIPNTLDRVDPDLVVNCAAFTAIDEAETEEELATIVNGIAVGMIADWCAERRRPLLTFSTDYVFNGRASAPYTESSEADPINAYGRSKLVGEKLALERRALIIRTSSVISGTHANFVSTMIRLAQNETVRVVDDQVNSPTVVDDLAAACLKVLRDGATGLLHLTNMGQTTWFRLARKAIELAGIERDRIMPCSTDEYPTPARRPPFSVLQSERLEELGLEPLPPWEDSLPAVVRDILSWI